MPIKLDTRKKTRKQKEKNKRRKKRNQSRKVQKESLPLFKRIRSLNQMTGTGLGRPNGVGTRSSAGTRSRSRRPSMQAIHGVVADAYASRMPVGSNHTKGIYANTQSGLSSKDFFKRTLRDMRRAQKPDQASLPPTYSYQNRPSAIYPHVQPIGLAEPSKSLVNALKAVPTASMPRGHRQTLLREAVAVPITTGLAEPGMPNWGQMYEATEEGRAQVTRAMTADELRKEDNYMQVQADMRTGGPGPSMGIWAPTRVRTPEEDGSPRGSMSSRESARRTGRRKLSMAEEYTFLQYYPHERSDMLAAAKIPGPEGQTARAQIRQMIHSVFSNSNSSKNAESHASSESSLSDEGRATIARMANLTQEEIERLTQLEMGHLIPGPEIQGYDRWYAVSDARDVLQQLNSHSNSNSARTSMHSQESIHSQESVDDPLHLSAGEIFLLRRQGPEGVEYIRRATTSADQEIVMDQVAEARAFLSRALMSGARRSRSGSRSRSRSRSRNRSGSRGSRGSRVSRTSTQSALNAYQRLHDAAFPNGSEGTSSLESSGTGSLESLEQLESVGSSGARSVRSSTGSIGSRGSRD